MTPRKLHAFRIDEDQLAAMQEIWERDGIQVSEQIRRAIRAWLDSKGGGSSPRVARKRAVTRRRDEGRKGA
jgi:hypothetical protein